MKVVTARDTKARRANPEWFTGMVWMEAAPAGEPPDAGITRVSFGPGSRTNWHTHQEGQILHILSGTCRAQTEGGLVTEIDAGGVVYFAPGERHWHGAAPDSFMVHLAINPATTGDGGTNWMEPVSDKQYGENG